MTEYVFENASEQASSRFAGLEATYDATSRAHIAARGISDGWECWEVGAGGGGLALWMAEQVAPTGHVLATDLDVSRTAPADVSNLTIERHDVTADVIPTGRYDLIHARLVLIHLPDRVRVMRDLAAALRPGGWLVVEEFFAGVDELLYGDTEDGELALYLGVRRALSAFIALSGVDDRYARHLPNLLSGLGLQDVGADGRLVFASGGSDAGRVVRANLLQVGEGMTARGLADAQQIARALELLDDPRFRFVLPLMISAWGRRPGGQAASGSTPR
jgi:SAM-dependent methyltransferase